MLTTQYYLQKTIRFIRSAFLSRTFNFITKQIQFTYMLPYFLSSMYCNDACRLGALKRPSANTLRRHVHYPNACLYSTFVCILMTHSFRPYVLHSNTHTHTHKHTNIHIDIQTSSFLRFKAPTRRDSCYWNRCCDILSLSLASSAYLRSYFIAIMYQYIISTMQRNETRAVECLRLHNCRIKIEN